MKRFVLTESERDTILNMYSQSKKVIKESTVTDLQNFLNDNFQSGLVADGKVGPKTLEAIESALAGKKEPIGDLPTKPAQQLPTGTTPSGESPATPPLSDLAAI